jgi:hypothetical protein
VSIVGAGPRVSRRSSVRHPARFCVIGCRLSQSIELISDADLGEYHDQSLHRYCTTIYKRLHRLAHSCLCSTSVEGAQVLVMSRMGWSISPSEGKPRKRGPL